METWMKIAAFHPIEKKFRVRCTLASCFLASKPAAFAYRDTAEAWAQDHATDKQHVTVVEEAR